MNNNIYILMCDDRLYLVNGQPSIPPDPDGLYSNIQLVGKILRVGDATIQGDLNLSNGRILNQSGNEIYPQRFTDTDNILYDYKFKDNTVPPETIGRMVYDGTNIMFSNYDLNAKKVFPLTFKDKLFVVNVWFSNVLKVNYLVSNVPSEVGNLYVSFPVIRSNIFSPVPLGFDVKISLTMFISLSQVSDIDYATPLQNDMVLKYDSTSKLWKPAFGTSVSSFSDAIFSIYDNVDNSKFLKFEVSGVSTGTTRTLTAPNVNTTIVGTDATQTITNKTITDPTNSCRATTIGTSGANVVINATPPTAGQVLVASNATNAQWQNPSGGNSYSDNLFNIYDDVDNTKILKFEVGTISTGTTRTLTVPNANDTLVAKETSDVLKNKNLDDTSNACRATSIGTTLANVYIDSTPPTAKQVLVTTNPTTAQWKDHSTFDDLNFKIQSFPVPTSVLKINCFDIPPNTTNYLKVPIMAPLDETTIVGNDTVQTLTNKTLTDTTNSCRATTIGTSGANVVINSTAPSVGQVLVATSATGASWQTPTAGTGFNDSTFNIFDNVDNTKKAQFECGSISTNTTRTFTLPNENTTVVGTTTAQSLSNKNLNDTTTAIVNTADPTKRFFFDLANLSTGVSLNFTTSAVTANRTYTLPNTTCGIVGTSPTQTLTNKTLTDPTNSCRATVIGTSGANVVISSTAPTAGQVLTATNGTNAQWQTPSSGVASFNDDLFNIFDNADNTKIVKFEVGGILTGTTRILSVPNANTTIVGIDTVDALTNKTLTDTTNSCRATAIGTSGANVLISNTAPTAGQVLTATNGTSAQWQTPSGGSSFSDAVFEVYDNADSSKKVAFELSGSNPSTKITIAGFATSNRSITLPDLTTQLVGRDTNDILTNKLLSDTTTHFINSLDSSKKLYINLANINTGVNLNIIAPAITSNTNYTLPNATCDIVGTTPTQTLTNKTIDSATNTVTCDKLRTTTGTVTINSATAPTSGQVLTATGATTANWQTVTASLNGLPLGVLVSNGSVTSSVSNLRDTYVDVNNQGSLFLGKGTPSNVGNHNIGIGGDSLSVSTSGARNIAIGVRSLKHITTGSSNTAIGHWAGIQCTNSSFNNTAIGAFAMGNYDNENVNGNNTAVGFNALANVRTGSSNISIGSSSSSTLLTGSNNVVIGNGAGCLDGSNNTVIGNVAQIVNVCTKSIAIGQYSRAALSNMCAIGGTGNNSVTVAIGGDSPNINSMLHLIATTNNNSQPVLCIDAQTLAPNASTTTNQLYIHNTGGSARITSQATGKSGVIATDENTLTFTNKNLLNSTNQCRASTIGNLNGDISIGDLNPPQAYQYLMANSSVLCGWSNLVLNTNTLNSLTTYSCLVGDESGNVLTSAGGELSNCSYDIVGKKVTVFVNYTYTNYGSCVGTDRLTISVPFDCSIASGTAGAYVSGDIIVNLTTGSSSSYKLIAGIGTRRFLSNTKITVENHNYTGYQWVRINELNSAGVINLQLTYWKD